MAFGKHRRRREAAAAAAAIAAQGAAAERARVAATEFAEQESQRVQAAEAARLAEMKRGNDLLAEAGNVAPDAQVIDDREKTPLRRRRGMFGLAATRGTRGLFGALGEGKAGGLREMLKTRFGS